MSAHCATTQNHCEDWTKRLFAGNLKGDWWKLLLLYTLTFGLMLFNTHGYYWDDWALIGNFTFDEMNLQFDQNGNVWYGYFEWIFITLQPYGIPLFRLFTFVSFFVCGLLVYEMLRYLKLFSPLELFFIVALFLLLPFNIISRNALINAPYTLCYLLFFIAFFACAHYCLNRNLILRILALVLFFISFTMNSLLVFYALPLAYMLYLSKPANSFKELLAFKNLFSWGIKHLDFILLPIVFYAVKISFFKPYGLYEGYNAIHLDAFLKSLIKTPIFSVIHLAQVGYILLGAFSLIVIPLSLYALYKAFKRAELNKRDVLGVVSGFVILGLGMFSYVVVYKYSTFNDLDDRFGILESLGCALVIVFGLNLLVKNTLAKLGIYVFLLIGAINAGIYAQNQLFLAYIKQIGVFEHLKENPAFENFHTFRIVGDVGGGIGDESFYQLNGLYKKYSGKSDKFISLISQADEDCRKACHLSPAYNCSQYTGDGSQYIDITIKHLAGNNFYSFLALNRMYLYNLFSPETFIQKAKNRYEVTLSPIKNASDSQN